MRPTPPRSGPANAESDQQPGLNAPQRKKVALVVEDDAAASRLIQMSLTRLEFAIHACPDGESALGFLQNNSVDLVCLDLMLPNQSGFEICEVIRRSPRHSQVPVLVITARSEPHARAFAEEAGANAYLVKPFKSADLEAQIIGLLGLRSSLGRRR